MNKTIIIRKEFKLSIKGKEGRALPSPDTMVPCWIFLYFFLSVLEG